MLVGTLGGCGAAQSVHDGGPVQHHYMPVCIQALLEVVFPHSALPAAAFQETREAVLGWLQGPQCSYIVCSSQPRCSFFFS